MPYVNAYSRSYKFGSARSELPFRIPPSTDHPRSAKRRACSAEIQTRQLFPGLQDAVEDRAGRALAYATPVESRHRHQTHRGAGQHRLVGGGKIVRPQMRCRKGIPNRSVSSTTTPMLMPRSTLPSGGESRPSPAR